MLKPKILSSWLSCWKMHPDVSSSLWYQGYRETADSSIFASSWHYCRRRKKLIKTWHSLHKESVKLDYKITIGDCHDFFLICLEQRIYLMLNSFHVLIKSQILFTEISVSVSFLFWCPDFNSCFAVFHLSPNCSAVQHNGFIFCVFTAPIHTIMYILVQISEFIYSSQEQCCQFSNWMNWLLA